jgi:hypothetical protein
MCYSCHGTNPEETLKQLTEMFAKKNYEFENFNTTSVNHLIISMSGHDSKECQTLAIKIYKEFLNWYETQENNYFPKHGMEQQYSYECLKNILSNIEKNLDAKEEDIMKMVTEEIEFCRKNVKQVSFMDMIKKGQQEAQLKKQEQTNKIIKFVIVGVVLALFTNSMFNVCF